MSSIEDLIKRIPSMETDEIDNLTRDELHEVTMYGFKHCAGEHGAPMEKRGGMLFCRFIDCPVSMPYGEGGITGCGVEIRTEHMNISGCARVAVSDALTP
jgi:hypothetical protein